MSEQVLAVAAGRLAVSELALAAVAQVEVVVGRLVVAEQVEVAAGRLVAERVERAA